MKKNSTLLLKHYELSKKVNGQVAFQALTPLFEIVAYRINMNKPLKQIVNNPRLNYRKVTKIYDRILVIYNINSSIARRNVLINSKRNDIIQYLNKHGSPSMLYTIYLPQINQMVPTIELTKILDSVFANKKAYKLNKTAQKSNQSLGQNQKMLLNFKNKVLFPFDLTKWEIQLQKAFPKSKSINRHHIAQSYFFMQINNIYIMQFCANRHYMYLDMKDFDSFLSKFNFIRFFYQFQSDNHFIAQKYAERLIKSMKWRTQKTEEYLLLNIRLCSWEKFIILIQDFCHCYETLYLPQQTDPIQNNSNK